MAGAVFGELDDVLKGSKASFCETVVIFDLGHDDDSVLQVWNFGCLGLIFRGRRSNYFVDPRKNVPETLVKHCV